MPKKKPSTRFPFINLEKALERAEAIYSNDKSGKGLSLPVAFSAWGYSSKSSGGFQTVGALKGYNLIEDEGSGEDRVIKLTDSAKQYFLSELSSDLDRLKREFASSPNLFAHLLEHWGAEVPDDPVARTYLKTKIQLNEQSARSALGIFKDNVEFANLKQASPSSEIISNGGQASADSISYGSGEGGCKDRRGFAHSSYSETSEGRGGQPQSVVGRPTEDSDRDIFSVLEGEVILISPRSFSKESLQDIGDWLDIMKRKLGRKVKDCDDNI